MKYPKISCMLCTYRAELLNRAIKLYQSQSYLNKELIIVYDEKNVDIENIIKNFNDSSIIAIKVKEKEDNLTLGDLRNICIEKAAGEYIAWWDDDDLFPKDRLEKQYNFIKDNNVKGCVLDQHYIYFHGENKAFLSKKRLWEGSLLCNKMYLHSFPFPSKKQFEDTPVIEAMYKDGGIIKMHDPSLMIYTYHTNNTCSRLHFCFLIDLKTIKDNHIEYVKSILDNI